MKKNKITVHMGTGTLTGPTSLTVKGEKGEEKLTAKHVIVATGARARDLPFAKADGERVWTYRHAMTPKEMPKKLLVIGSGAIGIEFASFYNDMGVDVTVVEMLDRIVPVEDKDVSAFLEKSLTKQGMTKMPKYVLYASTAFAPHLNHVEMQAKDEEFYSAYAEGFGECNRYEHAWSPELALYATCGFQSYANFAAGFTRR